MCPAWSGASASAASRSAGCPFGAARVIRAVLAAATPDAARLKLHVRDEVTEIWLQAGIQFEWLDAVMPHDSALRIVIQDAEEIRLRTRGVPVLAWIMFANERPGNIIRASINAAHSVLSRTAEAQTTRGSRVYVERYRHLLARTVGWSIAHEIGHYVLDSTRHDVTGLMRPRFGARELQNPQLASITLGPHSEQRLEARLATCARVAP